MTFPMNASPIADGEEANAVRWWQRFLRPINDAVEGLDDSGWVTLTLGASWTNFGSGYPNARYRRYRGAVYLDGLIHNGTTSSTIFTLPSGFLPVYQMSFAAICGTAGATNGIAQVVVTTAGVVQVNGYLYSGTNTFVSLSDIRYVAGG